ncbi:MAG TPA: hypothetical protein VF135_01035 [Terriglobales bacterium]
MKTIMVRTASALFCVLLLVSVGTAQSLNGDSEADVNSRFSRVLGADVGKLLQHYYLVKNGGVIELSAKDPQDQAVIKAIQKYLDMQKDLFEKGKNESEAEVHGKAPDGLAGIKRFRNDITFFSTGTDNGAVLRMFTVNEQAKQAVYEFMKFEIAEHKTGDALTAEQ